MAMNPSDTHIDRMAATFAERTPYLREDKAETENTWKEVLHFGRDEGMLTQIERQMKAKGRVDKVAEDAWSQAREYPQYDEAPTEVGE